MTTLVNLARRSWRLLLVTTLLGLAAGAVWSTTSSTYTSSASVLVTATDGSQSQQLLSEPQRFIKTLSRVATSGPVLADAATRLGGGLSVRSLKQRVDVQGGDASNVMDLSVRAKTARQADREVAAVTTSFLAGADGAGTLLERGGAVPSSGSWRPIALGAGAGLVLGALIALTWALVRRPLLSVDGVRPPAGGKVSVLSYPVTLSEGRQPGPDVERLAYDLLRECRGGGTVVVSGVAGAKAAHALYESLETVLCERLPEAVEAARAPLQIAAAGTGHTQDATAGDAVSALTRGLHLAEVAPVTTSALVNLLALSARHLLLVAELGKTTESQMEAALSRLTGSPAEVTVVMVKP